ncbi:MAG: folate family ECF transporter S component [Oscillospiraceae bacterium]|nr:folate family ECF transporter S component [Oscillospiraceae bacterium]
MNSIVNFFAKAPQKFSGSAKELGKIQSIVIIAMFLALRVVLGMFGNFQLSFFPYAKLGFMFLPIALTSYYFGPVCSMVVAVAGDVLSYLMAPPAASFTPGITAGYLLEGMVVGLILYKENITVTRTAVSQVVATIIGGLAINTYFIYLIYGLTYLQVLGLRAVILIPWCIVEVAIIVIIVKTLDRVPMIKKIIS